MTSVLNVDTIADKAGTGPVGLTKQSAAKAYNTFDFANTAQRDSFNVSTTTDRGTGSSYANLVSAMGTATYNTVSSSSPTAIGSMTTTNYNRAAISQPDTASRIAHNSYTTSGTGAPQDDPYTAVVAHGDLA